MTTAVRARQAGFSLLEVLVAFAIATLSLTVLSQIFGRNAHNLDLTRDYDRAAVLAENLMAEYGAPQTSEDEISDSVDQFRWQVRIEPYLTAESDEPTSNANDEPPAGGAQLVQIVVDVDWTERGRTRSVSLKAQCSRCPPR